MHSSASSDRSSWIIPDKSLLLLLLSFFKKMPQPWLKSFSVSDNILLTNIQELNLVWHVLLAPVKDAQCWSQWIVISVSLGLKVKSPLHCPTNTIPTSLTWKLFILFIINCLFQTLVVSIVKSIKFKRLLLKTNF